MTNIIWYVYMLECLDRTLYIGITQDIKARLTRHLEGNGGRYTRSRGVAALVGLLPCGEERTKAGQMERKLKRLTAGKKREQFQDISHLIGIVLPGWRLKRAASGVSACWIPTHTHEAPALVSQSTPAESVCAIKLLSVEIQEHLDAATTPSIAQWISWLRLLDRIKSSIDSYEFSGTT